MGGSEGKRCAMLVEDPIQSLATSGTSSERSGSSRGIKLGSRRVDRRLALQVCWAIDCPWQSGRQNGLLTLTA